MASADPKPVVYSGIFHSTQKNIDFLVRVHFIDVTPTESKTPVYNTIVVVHLGSDATASYVSLNYDRIGTLRANHEVVMPGLQSPNADHLPIIHLLFDETSQTATGTMTSRDEAAIQGTFKLSNGWDFHATGPVVQPVSGIYDAKCTSTTDGSGMQMSGLELSPSRFNAKSSDSAFALNRILFRGSGVCKYDGMKNCLTIDSGHYKILDNTVEFSQGNWMWECERPDPDTLQCKPNVRYESCTFKRKAQLPGAELASANLDVPVATMTWEAKPQRSLSPTNGSLKDFCDKWNGDYFGQLTHRLGGKQQPVSIQIRAYLQDAQKNKESGEDGELCGMLLSAILHFYTYDSHGEKIAFSFSKPQIIPLGVDTLQISDSATDLMLNLKLSDDGQKVMGIWNSRIFGVVGAWSAMKNGTFPTTTNDKAVFGLSGYYKSTELKDTIMTVTARDLGATVNLLDPFGAIQLIGWRQSKMDLTGLGGRVAAMRQPIGSTFYDYFVNFVAFYAGALYTGHATANGLFVRTTSQTYIGFADPLDKVWTYTRQAVAGPL